METFNCKDPSLKNYLVIPTQDHFIHLFKKLVSNTLSLPNYKIIGQWSFVNDLNANDFISVDKEALLPRFMHGRKLNCGITSFAEIKLKILNHQKKFLT